MIFSKGEFILALICVTGWITGIFVPHPWDMVAWAFPAGFGGGYGITCIYYFIKERINA